MIRELAQKGNSAYSIGKKLNISKNTVKKYMQITKAGKKLPKTSSKLDPFKPRIHELMQAGIFNCVVILERLQEIGYRGGKTLIKDYVHPFRPAKSLPAVRRYETLPSKQAQMDWGICQYQDDEGTIHKVAAFAMILGNSRTRYIEFTKRCDLASLERCILNSFEYYHGVPEVVLTDNMKTVVDGHEAGKTLFNAKFESFAVDMGFIIKACKIRRPETKGKVERLVKYIKENFFPGRNFYSLEDLNKQAIKWCNHVNSKPHCTTGLIPLRELSKEPLKSIPDKVITDRYRWEHRKISKDGFVSFDGINYGVNWQYSGQEANVRLYNNTVQIYVNNTQIAEYAVKPSKARYIFKEGQYKGLAEKHGLANPQSLGYLKNSQNVISRPLNVYNQLVEGIANA